MRFVHSFLRQMLAGFAVLAVFTAILGVGYPVAVWAISRIDTQSAEGSPLRDADGCVVGSALIGVDPQVADGQVADGQPDPYFHARVTGSVADDDAFAPGDPSAALPTNQGPSSEVLTTFVEQRRAAVADRENVDPSQVPVDAVTGSGSGIDPDISPAYAALQVPRVAQVNGMSVDDVEALVRDYTDGPQYGVLGAAAVNVPQLNVALGLTAPHCSPG
ncbi:potassium-transporting ATPase subunit C [Rhodococcoides kyotonense]|uniref:Potassium-transporting ATPase KdpC subunit n=1 Tax=Rhodococcoides kyotonense TaxID=398843 RepID=A0A239KH82_9NOCA|nr:potassium-transporting ATPase subunit C [Rhodococcus kyotonensis]SNT17746.1 K+-transporting ATPase ATPase C chain [Rhodococcus kyotonensis]